jgi:hypothetical protein
MLWLSKVEESLRWYQILEKIWHDLFGLGLKEEGGWGC